MSFGTIAASTWLSIALFVTSTIYQSRQMKKLKRQQEEAADKAKGIMVPSDSPSGALPIIYGKTKVGGSRVFVKTASNIVGATNLTYDRSFVSGLGESNNVTAVGGEKNEYLFLEQAIAAYGVSDVSALFINDILITPSTLENIPEAKKFANSFWIGASYSGNTSNPHIVANFPERATATFSNIANLSGIFKINRDDPQYQGVPEITVAVKGKKIKSVQRTLVNNLYVYSLSPTATYSNNSALVLLDYMVNHANIDISNIDLESFYRSAQICDTVVDTNKVFGGEIESPSIYKSATANALSNQLTVATGASELLVGMYVSGPSILPGTSIVSINGSTITLSKVIGNAITDTFLRFSGTKRDIKLYTFNGAIVTDNKYRDNINTILQTMTQATLVWSEGKYNLILDYPANNEAINLAYTITDDDLIAESISISWPDIESKYNRCEVKFTNEALDFQDDSVYWPGDQNTTFNFSNNLKAMLVSAGIVDETDTSINEDELRQLFITQDNGAELQTSIDLPGVVDKYHALAKAEEVVLASRYSKDFTFTVRNVGVILEPGDIILLNSEVLNLPTPEYIKLTSVAAKEDGSVEISGSSFHTGLLSWNEKQNQELISKSYFNFELTAPANFQFSPVSSNSSLSSGSLSWNSAANYSVLEYYVTATNVETGIITPIGYTKNTYIEVLSLLPGLYNFAVSGFTLSGRRSPEAVILNQAVSPIDLDKSLTLTASSTRFIKTANKNEILPLTIDITANAVNIDSTTYTWKIDGTVVQTGSNSVLSVAQFSNTSSKTISCEITDALTNRQYKAYITVFYTANADSVMSITNTKPSVFVPVDSSNENPYLVDTDSILRIYENSDILQYNSSLSINGSWKIDSITNSGVTISETPYTPSANYVTVADITGISADSGSLVFNVSGKRLDGTLFTISFTQYFYRVRRGVPGSTGPVGSQVANLRLYQWSISQPASPTGNSTYNWSTGVNSNYTDADGWSVNVPTNPGTPNVSLWLAEKSQTAPGDVVSTSIVWSSGVTVSAWSKNGINGVKGDDGAKTTLVTVYQWAISIPSSPAGTGTYTWLTGDYDDPVNWSKSITSSPSTGFTLWSATVRLTAAASAETSSINWSTASIVASGYAGTNGSNGDPGPSGRRTGILELYKWASTEPTSNFPSGDSTYTWSTGQFTLPSSHNDWTLTPGNPVAGSKLYVVRQVYSDTLTTSTSIVSWSAAAAYSISLAGTNGSNGSRTAVLELYKWAASTPTEFPSGNSTYTWNNGTFTAPATLNGWSITPGSPTAGYTLYGCSVLYTDTLTASESTVAWNTSTAYPLGKAGTNGDNGTRTAILDVYKWAATEPTSNFPSGNSTYTWSTGQFTAPENLNGWSLIPPTPVIGQTLWIARTIYSDSSTTAESTVAWNASSAKALSRSGNNGNNGYRTAVLELYKWSTDTPTLFPAGTSVYTWADGTFTIPGTQNGWLLVPGSPAQGQKLYACSVSYTDNLTGAESPPITWNTSTAYIVGYAGIDGDDGGPGPTGPQGASYVTAYARIANNPTPVSGIITMSGNTLPSQSQSNATWGLNVVWYSSDPNPASTNTLYQADGIYDPYTGNTTWTTPYISSLKVGTLQAITANMGTLTAGTINVGETVNPATSYAIGTRWNTLYTAAPSVGITAIAKSTSGRYVVGGTAGYLAYSDDMVNFTKVALPYTGSDTVVNSIVYWPAMGSFMASVYGNPGQDNYIYTSTDGVTWTARYNVSVFSLTVLSNTQVMANRVAGVSIISGNSGVWGSYLSYGVPAIYPIRGGFDGTYAYISDYSSGMVYRALPANIPTGSFVWSAITTSGFGSQVRGFLVNGLNSVFVLTATAVYKWDGSGTTTWVSTTLDLTSNLSFLVGNRLIGDGSSKIIAVGGNTTVGPKLYVSTDSGASFSAATIPANVGLYTGLFESSRWMVLGEKSAGAYTQQSYDYSGSGTRISDTFYTGTDQASLLFDGTKLSFRVPFVQNKPIINQQVTVDPDYNALTVGPVTISNSGRVTIPPGSVWTIL